jgi:hypothetical protein
VPLDTLLTTVGNLWPDAEVMVGKGKAHPDQHTFLVVPHAAHPRLLVPALPRGAAAGALRRFSSALRPADAASRMAVSLLLQGGGSAVLRDRVTVSGHGDSIETQLGRVLGEPVVCSLGVGSDRGNRKPVLQVFDGRGRSIAFAKVAESAYVERLLEAEHEHLVQLAGHRLPPYLRVPEVIWFGRWRGLRVLVLTDLRPSAFATVRPHDVPAPRQLMREFATSFRLEPAPLTSTALWTDALGILRSLGDPQAAAVFGAALEAVERYADTDEHPVGVWHGDWTPWNMGRRGRQLVLWDWERFRVGVPLGLDPVHYAVHAWCRKRGFRVESVLAGLDSAGEPVSIEAAGGSLEAAAYLVAITGRYLEAAQHEGGVPAREAARVMLEVLRTWTRV